MAIINLEYAESLNRERMRAEEERWLFAQPEDVQRRWLAKKERVQIQPVHPKQPAVDIQLGVEVAPLFQIQRVYLKDMSFEQPNPPEISLSQEQPAFDIQMGVEGAPVADGLFEVTVTATIHAKIADKTVFLLEAKQAGIFELRNIPQEQLGAILGIACPQIVYPQLRGNVADVVQRGGFPPVHLAEINFQAMYEQQQARQAGQ